MSCSATLSIEWSRNQAGDLPLLTVPATPDSAIDGIPIAGVFTTNMHILLIHQILRNDQNPMFLHTY